MSNPERFGTFYGIWPILDGKALSFQWGEVRLNTAETKALVRSSFQELEDGVDELNSQRGLLGLAFGDLLFNKKYRFFYNKTTLELCCQRNTGTVTSPIWVDAWCVRFSDGQFQAVGEGGIRSNAGFYGPGLQSLEEVAESGTSADVSIRNPTKIFFNADDGFGVQAIVGGANAGQPEIRFTQPFGRAEAFEKSGRVWQVNHNFGITPVIVQVMDNDDRVVIPDVADVSDPNTAWFYFNAVFSGTAYIASGGVGATTLLPRDPFYLVVRTNEQSRAGRVLKPNADLIFDRHFFYVNVDLDPAHGGAHKSAYVSLHATPGVITDHGQLSGLADDDHLQYAKTDGSRDITGHQDFLGSVKVNRTVTAEAFYLEPGSGGEVSKQLNNVLIKSKDGNVVIDDDLVVTGDMSSPSSFILTAPGYTVTVAGDTTINTADTLALIASNQLNLTATGGTINSVADGDITFEADGAVEFTSAGPINFNNGRTRIFKDGGIRSVDKIVAEAFYLISGGEVGANVLSAINIRESDNTPPTIQSDTLIFDSTHFYLGANSSGDAHVSLRPWIYGQVGAFQKQQFFVPLTLAISGGNVAWNLDNAQVGALILSSSATLSNPTNIKTGGQYTLIVTQTGSNTLSFGTAYKFGDAGSPTLSSAAGKRDVLVFTGFGSEMFLTGVSTGY